MMRRLRDLRGASGLDRGGLLLAIAVYTLSAVFGWAAVGAMIVMLAS